jgi:hypothetical protein
LLTPHCRGSANNARAGGLFEDRRDEHRPAGRVHAVTEVGYQDRHAGGGRLDAGDTWRLNCSSSSRFAVESLAHRVSRATLVVSSDTAAPSTSNPSMHARQIRRATSRPVPGSPALARPPANNALVTGPSRFTQPLDEKRTAVSAACRTADHRAVTAQRMLPSTSCGKSAEHDKVQTEQRRTTPTYPHRAVLTAMSTAPLAWRRTKRTRMTLGGRWSWGRPETGAAP